jgi:hypothetical protein
VLKEPKESKEIPAFKLQSERSFGEFHWPSPAQTNLGSHIHLLGLDNTPRLEPGRALFTSPLIKSVPVTHAGKMTPKSIEKVVSSDNQLTKQAARAALIKFKPSTPGDHHYV